MTMILYFMFDIEDIEFNQMARYKNWNIAIKVTH